jgi:hypothetical protein
MIDFDTLTKKLNPQEPENRCIVRLKTSAWTDKRGVYLKKSITYLRRLSKGYMILKEDAENICAEVIEGITNLDECEDGIYEIVTCNESYDWEMGYVDNYDYMLVTFGD